jgi:hypothetical protein
MRKEKEQKKLVTQAGAAVQQIKPRLTVYVILQALLLAAVRLTEFTTPSTVYCRVMYAPIVLDFAMMTYLYFRFGRSRLDWRDNLIPLAFLFMLCADTFLCLIDDIYIMGYLFFCCVELCYALYLKPGKVNLILRALLAAALLAALYAGGMLDVSNAVAIFNISLLVGNAASAWSVQLKHPGRRNLLFAVGITLFFVCDGSIAARTLLTPGTAIHTVFALLVWTAYIPAQVLILLSYVDIIKKS